MESMEMKKKNWANIIFLGMGFMLLFTAFQTSAFVQVSDFYQGFFIAGDSKVYCEPLVNLWRASYELLVS